jgi:alkenylglycerophosphocholine/alkenylglycerophosphoethanolamine hydrolase
MVLWVILTLIFAALEVIAVSKNLQRLEYVAKPAVMICLFLWLYSSTGFQSNAFWFGLGILFSLVGDVLFMIPLDQMFLFGLFTFLLAHISYITGLREEIVTITAWSLILAVFIAINVGRLLRRIVGAMRIKGKNKLIVPVILYGTVISVMLYAAMSTIFNPLWKTSAAFFVSLGAFLFCASDAVLAWNQFVSPIKDGRVWNITLYYLGQMGLIAGVISQFGK